MEKARCEVRLDGYRSQVCIRKQRDDLPGYNNQKWNKLISEIYDIN